MKKLIFLIPLLFHLTGLAQETHNSDFEGSRDIAFQFEEDSLNNLWQIGTPQKTYFNQANSLPNALVTDTVNTYPNDTTASFIIKFNSWQSTGFPLLQLGWLQKTDMEEGVDGGVIEASYDGGNTWLNVFNDTIYRPVIVGTYNWDTLYNGQAGITGKSDWNWTAICWGSYRGTQPWPTANIIVKFTFVADAVDTKQEGWMMDNFLLEGGIIGSTPNLSNLKSISVYPTPTKQSIFIDVSDMLPTETKVTIYNTSGVEMFSQLTAMPNFNEMELNLDELPTGIYNLLVNNNEITYHQKIIKIE